MFSECTTFPRGKQAELALSRIFAEQLPESQVLPTWQERPSSTLALVKTPEEIDEGDGIDFWVYHKNVGWISLDITLDNDARRLKRKRSKEVKEQIYIQRFELGVLLRASRGSHSDLEQVIEILTNLFVEELAATKKPPKKVSC